MSLKAKVVTGTKWVAFANIFKQILQVLSLVIFARLLSPDDFGLFALMMIFVSFLVMFTDMGTASALVHIKNPSNKLLSSVLFFNLFIGTLFCLLLIIFSGYISIFFNSPKLEPLLQLISINFVIMSLGVVQKVRYEKELDFKYLTLIESFSIFIGISVGIIFALLGFGVYSLVLQVLITSILSVGLLWKVSKWRPLLYFSIEDIKIIWKYTANLSAFNFINYFARNADNFLIGKFLNSSALGVYSLAYNIMLYPLQNISRVLLRILFPAFSKIQDDNKKFKEAYLKTIFFISLVSFPIMFGLIATADIFVSVLFGDKWANLAPILMILAPVGVIQSIGTTNGSIFMAKGNTNLLLRVGIWSTIITIIFFIGGIFYGVEGVAISYLLSNIVLFYPVFKISWGQIELSVSEGIKKIFPILLISSFMGLVVWIFGQWLNQFHINSIIQLMIMVISGNIIYISLIYLKYGNIKKMFKE
ncbi:Lipopolysaccharide biosynthesis protein WzxC [hydrothermal vent metagenome]|uniref:Lipopolysaccharide biosynthesis protein WzxC n=1 Tax=hydrothermal vent metagenome TaxID=652676 RepID=A0A1W1BMI7_9ZZZZ